KLALSSSTYARTFVSRVTSHRYSLQRRHRTWLECSLFLTTAAVCAGSHTFSHVVSQQKSTFQIAFAFTLLALFSPYIPLINARTFSLGSTASDQRMCGCNKGSNGLNLFTEAGPVMRYTHSFALVAPLKPMSCAIP